MMMALLFAAGGSVLLFLPFVVTYKQRNHLYHQLEMDQHVSYSQLSSSVIYIYIRRGSGWLEKFIAGDDINILLSSSFIKNYLHKISNPCNIFATSNSLCLRTNQLFYLSRHWACI
jgi:hypothetical protein